MWTTSYSRTGRNSTRDPAIHEAFEQRRAESNRAADAVLLRSPHDRNALLAKVFNLGLEADYLSMIEKRNMAALRYTKDGGLLAGKLLAVFPDCYDAYLAVGVENYLLGVRPAPERWIFRLYGAEADKERGIRTLELTAQKGHYLLPFAQLLLAVAALRDKDFNRARELLRNLAQEFPSNNLYQKRAGAASLSEPCFRIEPGRVDSGGARPSGKTPLCTRISVRTRL